MNTANTTPALNVARRPIATALTLGLFGALLVFTPPAIGQVVGRNHATTLAETPPIPTRIVQPRIGDRYEGVQVEMTFWVDKSGRPYGVGCSDLGADQNLVAMLSQTIGFWKFAPAKNAEGNPVARKVMLPVSIVPSRDRTETLVALGPIK